MSEFLSVDLFKVKKINTLKRGNFEFLMVTAKPKVLDNLKTSSKKSWKDMEFKELKRVQTLYSLHISNDSILNN